jgi:hypothetical protein
MGVAITEPFLIALPKWISADQYAAIAGCTRKAIERKCQDGVWRERVEWIKAPDGRIRVNPRAIDLWIESGPP